MSRRLGVIAWVAATLFSVAASTAAVERVRAQVTERPAVVSLATLRAATTSSTAPPTVSAVTPAPSVGAVSTTPTTTTTTAAETTSTTAVEATPATTLEATPVPPTAEPHEAVPDVATVTETRTFRGGTVTIAFDGETIELVGAVPDEGYEVDVEGETPDRVVVRFVDRRRSSALVARVMRGELQIQIFD